MCSIYKCWIIRIFKDVGSGVVNIDDVRNRLGLPALETEFSKMFFVTFSSDSFICQFQLLNQLVLLVLLYYVFIMFAGIDGKLEKMPKWIKAIITFISTMTLEIYLVQYAIIPRTNVLGFPINWIIITATIAVSAIALHYVSKLAISGIDRLTEKISKNN